MRQKNTVYLIKRAEMTFEKIANDMLSPYGITHSQFKCVKYLFLFENGTLNQRDIEYFFNMSNPTVSKILKNLESEGWIERIPNNVDKRQKNLVLTQKAINQRQLFHQLGILLEEKLVRHLNAEEKLELQRLLRKMLDITIE